MTDLLVSGVRHRLVDAGEVHLHVAEAGPAGGPLVLLLHGFPEFWWSWRHQLPALADAEFHAVAPDLRGYHLSDQPQEVAAYAIGRLAGDVAGLVRALGAERADVVGHDWGGMVAWAFATREPGRLRRLAILNAPHPAVMAAAMARPRQAVRSSYMALFQLPALPERLLAAHDHALLRRALRAMRARPVDDAEIEPYVDAARRGGLRGGLAYYRAAGRAAVARRRRRGADEERPRRRVEAPVLVLWGARDPVLGPELARPPEALVPDARVVMLPDASHDVMLDEPQRVNAELIGFLRP
jgi:pimeloyl-ACP methyl ester carboxylesterase